VKDVFRLTIPELPACSQITKRNFISGKAKVFDVLGWFSPTVITVKILLQRVWESRIDWDEFIPDEIWTKWITDLPYLCDRHIPRCYFPTTSHIKSFQLHGFSDASENAYSGVIYLRVVDSMNQVHVSLVISKTRVSPIKRLTIPRLELCGAQILARLLSHVRDALLIPISQVFAWTDSTIVLNWLSGNPRRFKVYVGNRVSSILNQIPYDRWNHVSGVENPADCASRGVYPLNLLAHDLWWCGPHWLKLDRNHWPHQQIPSEFIEEEEKKTCFLVQVQPKESVIPLNQYSSFLRLQRITAWVMRFAKNCRYSRNTSPTLTISELMAAEKYWIREIQRERFPYEVVALLNNKDISDNSSLLPLQPFIHSF
jgi:hypothetical protein